MQYLIKDTTLQDIANAIREKSDITDLIPVNRYADAIKEIEPVDMKILTQDEYDELEESGEIKANTFYFIVKANG